MKQSGGKLYLAINSLVPDEPGKNERLQGCILDLADNRVTAPWMRRWPKRLRKSTTTSQRSCVPQRDDRIFGVSPRLSVASGGSFFLRKSLGVGRLELGIVLGPVALSRPGATVPFG